MKYFFVALCARCLTVGSTVQADMSQISPFGYSAPDGGVSLAELEAIILQLSQETDTPERSYWQQYHEGTLRAEELNEGVFEVSYIQAGGGLGEVLIDINF